MAKKIILKENPQNRIEIKGELKFQSLDLEVARFSMAANQNIVFGRRIDIPADVIRKAVEPETFNPEVHKIKGTFGFLIEIEK